MPKEAASDNPYLSKCGEAGKKWENIKNKFNLTLKDNVVSAHCIRVHTDGLIKKRRIAASRAKKLSGVDEEENELTNLLNNLIEDIDEENRTKMIREISSNGIVKRHSTPTDSTSKISSESGYSSNKNSRIEQSLETLIELQISYFNHMRETDREKLKAENEDRKLRKKEIENQSQSLQQAHEERKKEIEIQT